MILTAILNAILAVGVIAVVVTPLAWAVLAQRREQAPPAPSSGATARVPHNREGARARRPQSKPIVGRV